MSSQINKHKRTELLEMIAHLSVGLSVLLKGVDKSEHPGKELYAASFILLGVFVIAGTVLYKKLEPKIGHIKVYVLLVESFVMVLVGYLHWKEGSHLIHYFNFAVSVGFLVAIYILIKKKHKIIPIEISTLSGEETEKSIDSQEEKN